MSAPGDEESKHAQHELERFYSARPSITPDDEVPAAEVELTPHAGAHAAPEAMAETVAETAPEAAPEAAPAMKPDQRGWERETTRMLPDTVSDQVPTVLSDIHFERKAIARRGLLMGVKQA